jgi:hypothetical protein
MPAVVNSTFTDLTGWAVYFDGSAGSTAAARAMLCQRVGTMVQHLFPDWQITVDRNSIFKLQVTGSVFGPIHLRNHSHRFTAL